MRKPRYYDTVFGGQVREAMRSGELTFRNIKEWDRKMNGGLDPVPPFNTGEIMRYYEEVRKCR